MDHPQTPRILAPHLSNFQHRIVRMLGKVVQLRGETAIIDAGGQVDVILNRVSALFSSRSNSMVTTSSRDPKMHEEGCNM
jgi:hypothetical protein